MHCARSGIPYSSTISQTSLMNHGGWDERKKRLKRTCELCAIGFFQVRSLQVAHYPRVRQGSQQQPRQDPLWYPPEWARLMSPFQYIKPPGLFCYVFGLILMRAFEPLVIDIELLLKMDHYKIGICQHRPFRFLICLVMSTKGNPLY